ncbi:GNAT family N-acetyltransferase [Rubellimicrobium rubrum]|uniref:GNAT family N-acetyltransferase n=1 Tax=Rubellimicrobium rubrum TaxID=2585369 RepID=A0A5C4MZ31_9RHOB|nr:GNAT family N-acetyltransferase [Rubellimicrobium rubrum]TNC50130.1 GNAT family N-acetyltransferase [Rubellimicrobium rubrum]
MIRPLHPGTDQDAVLDLYARASDYLDLESGRVPTLAMVEEFFSDAPPGGNPSKSLKLGLFNEERLLGLADLAFGYPNPTDAYLGLMMLAADARGRGLGRIFLRHVEAAARERGAVRLLLAVLEANPRGRAFWEVQGFGAPKVFAATRIGERTHVRIRLEKPL